MDAFLQLPQNREKAIDDEQQVWLSMWYRAVNNTAAVNHTHELEMPYSGALRAADSCKWQAG